ncbi:unnamed protein product [marine sediment metagenome]|uniref:Uncharacterized protein n=1 Tax=marine sediment metagenome TaxID=412755 RepID=X1LUE3_9ZZZZ
MSIKSEVQDERREKMQVAIKREWVDGSKTKCDDCGTLHEIIWSIFKFVSTDLDWWADVDEFDENDAKHHLKTVCEPCLLASGFKPCLWIKKEGS